MYRHTHTDTHMHINQKHDHTHTTSTYILSYTLSHIYTTPPKKRESSTFPLFSFLLLLLLVNVCVCVSIPIALKNSPPPPPAFPLLCLKNKRREVQITNNQPSAQQKLQTMRQRVRGGIIGYIKFLRRKKIKKQKGMKNKKGKGVCMQMLYMCVNIVLCIHINDYTTSSKCNQEHCLHIL